MGFSLFCSFEIEIRACIGILISKGIRRRKFFFLPANLAFHDYDASDMISYIEILSE